MKRRVIAMDLVSSEDDILVERSSKPLGVEIINPYAVGKHERSDIIALAEEISKADAFVQATTNSKLQIIAQQMRFLQEQAKQVLREAKESLDLNHAACNFKKIPGCTYHLYRQESGQTYFSMLSPQDWSYRGGPPHTYIGSYYFKEDMTWIPEEKLRLKTLDINEITNLCILPVKVDQKQIEAYDEKME